MLRHHPARHPWRAYAALAVALPALGGCPLVSMLLNNTLDLPIDLVSPPVEFNVDSSVGGVEAQACASPGSESCLLVTAICTASGAASCSPPALPSELPAEVDVPGQGAVATEDLLADLGITQATEIEVALPLDVASALADQGADLETIDGVSIGAIALNWPENSLTFDVPPLDLFVAKGEVASGANIEDLIADGSVKKVGTIGSDLDGDGAIDVGQPGGSTESSPVYFVDGGNALFTDALKSPSFTIVTAVPAGRGVTLKAKEGDPDTLLKPAGKAKLELAATIIYAVSAADVAGAVDSATP